MDLTRKDLGRFATYYIPGARDKCWLWLGGINSSGYGNFTRKGITRQAQRVAYYMEYGAFDYTLSVLHNCDNPPCVNPFHLFLGTHINNMNDMVIKNRSCKIQGAEHWNAKLSEVEIEEVRDLYKSGSFSQRQLARKYNVAQSRIWVYVNYKRRSDQ